MPNTYKATFVFFESSVEINLEFEKKSRANGYRLKYELAARVMSDSFVNSLTVPFICRPLISCHLLQSPEIEAAALAFLLNICEWSDSLDEKNMRSKARRA